MPNFRTHLITSSDLQLSPALNAEITSLINRAFSTQKSLSTLPWDTSTLRFPTSTGLIDLLSTTGICAILTDEEYASRVVASASLTPWPSEVILADDPEARGEAGWEIKCVVVEPGGEYVKRGLVGRCVRVLEEWVVARERERGGDGKARLWIIAAEELNGGYWKRRGFREVRRRVAVKGTWGCGGSFEVVTMVREVDVKGKGDGERKGIPGAVGSGSLP